MRLTVPKNEYDYEVFSQKYGLYLLANNKVFTLEFPDEPPVEGRSSEGIKINIENGLVIYAAKCYC